MIQTMQAIHIKNTGPESRLVFREIEPPAPGPDELLVRVEATALNRADLMQRRGLYPPPPGASPILGLDMAGVVEACGEACSGWTPGDRVMGLLAGGGYAQYITIHHQMAMRIPARLSFEEGAAIPEAFLTAYQALFLLGELNAGASVLLHAGASGVGTAAIQMARETGATVFVTASAGKHDLCRRLGASAAIDYRAEDFADRVADLTGNRGVDVIVDVIGAPYLAPNVASLAVDGRLVLLALMGGSTVEALDLRPLFRKRLQAKASTLRNRSLDYKIALTRAFAEAMLPRFESGALVPVIDLVYDWREVEQAHQRMAANLNAGKIVLRVTG